MSLGTDVARADASVVDGDLDSNSDDLSNSPSRIESYLPEIFFSVTVLTLVVIRVIQQCKVFARMPGSDWNSSEWMIDYAGGFFVRRGLSGAFLAQTMRLTDWGFLSIWITITTVAYVGLCVYMLVVSGRLRAGGGDLAVCLTAEPDFARVRVLLWLDWPQRHGLCVGDSPDCSSWP